MGGFPVERSATDRQALRLAEWVLNNGEPLAVSTTAALADALLATGFSYVRDEPGRDDNVARIARVLPICRDLRRYGSAELDLCMVGSGQFDGGLAAVYTAPVGFDGLLIHSRRDFGVIARSSCAAVILKPCSMPQLTITGLPSATKVMSA